MKSLASPVVLSETRERLRTLKVDDHPRWGMMTAKQMVRHLSCSCEVALGERTVRPVKGLPPVLVKWMALRSGLRWMKNMRTPPELKRAMAVHCDVNFDELVNVTIEKVERLARESRFAPWHPMFGPMTEADWMRWGYLHADHHLRQFGR
jgi:Protein of unknown function (DUF1569)